MSDLFIAIFALVLTGISLVGVYFVIKVTEPSELKEKIKAVKKQHKINEKLEELGLLYINTRLGELQQKVYELNDVNHRLLDRIINLENKGKK